MIERRAVGEVAVALIIGVVRELGTKTTVHPKRTRPGLARRDCAKRPNGAEISGFAAGSAPDRR